MGEEGARCAMTRLERIRADLPTATYEPADVAWLVETVDTLSHALRAWHERRYCSQSERYGCSACMALARLEEPDCGKTRFPFDWSGNRGDAE